MGKSTFSSSHNTAWKKRANKKSYYTTLLKSVQITHKTSTNIQRYSDSMLFVHLVICIVGNRYKTVLNTLIQF